MADARILILEDDPIWQQNVAEALQPIAAAIHAAATLAEAETLLQTCYVNVAVVDWSLVMGDAQDDQGAQFMQAIRNAHLTDTVRLVVLSAYPSHERLRAGFREFNVVDFLEKRSFDADALLHTVLDALARNHLDHDVDIEIEGDDGDLGQLWKHFTWAQREPANDLNAELYDLLRRVLPDATRLVIRQLPAGQSGAGILRVKPFFDSQAGSPMVVKFGKRDKIQREHDNFQRYVENFVAPHAGVQLVCALGRAMGAIRYQFIGAELNPENDFAHFYQRHAFDSIRRVLDNLFKVTCKRWYDNLEMPREERDLVELYRQGLRIEWEEVWRGMRRTGADPEGEQLTFPGVAGALPNPRRWLAKRGNRLDFEVVRTVTHGDLNERNILVTDEDHTWLIDFYRTGWNHILRDAVVLETAIKFNLANCIDLTAFRDLDDVLLKQTQLGHLRIPTAHSQSKALHTLAHLRRLAASLNGVSDDMAEYNASLLLATLNLLRFDFMRDYHQQALLSAARLCQRLDNH